MITVRRKPMNTPSMFNAFDDLWLRNWPSDSMKSNKPAVNVAEFDQHFQLEFAAPGFDKGDFNIEVEKNQLSVSVEKKEKEETTQETYTRREFTASNFKRLFTLPDSVDGEKVEAHYENGILRVFLPKKESALAPAKRVIDIK